MGIDESLVLNLSLRWAIAPRAQWLPGIWINQ
jgi:hypothetical protein